MQNKTFSLRKLFANRRFSVIFALVVAFVFWLVITIDQTEVISKTFANISVNITTEGSFAGNMGLQVIAIENQSNANVTAHGPNSSVSSLDVSDILITADLSNVTGAGTYPINLEVQAGAKKTGVTFDVSPKTVNVTFDYVDTVEFDLMAVAKGISLKKDADTNLFVGTPVINSTEFNKISISGARADMKLLSRVEAVISAVEAIGESKTYEADIVLYDSNGKVLDNEPFTIPVEKVKVTVPVYKERTVAVVPTFTNEPRGGAGSERLKSSSLSKIAIYGLPETVDELDKLKLSAIDFREIEAGKLTFTVRLELPDGIYTKSQIGDVTVSFNGGH